MPENLSPLPPDDPCFQMVATYNAYVGARIDDFLHAERYLKFADNFAPLVQCCGELRAKIESLRPANTNPDALRTFTIPPEIFDAQSECAKHPYFLKPAAGGDSPADSWFTEQAQSRSEYWLQQYTDLSAELQGCCVRHLGPCLLKGAEARSCVEGLLPGEPPPAALPSPEAAAPAALPPAAPVSGETQVPALFQQVYDHLTETVYLEFPFGLTYLVPIALGVVLGWLLFKAEQKLGLFQWIGDRSYDLYWFLWGRRRWERKVEADRKAAGSEPAELPAEPEEH